MGGKRVTVKLHSVERIEKAIYLDSRREVMWIVIWRLYEPLQGAETGRETKHRSFVVLCLSQSDGVQNAVTICDLQTRSYWLRYRHGLTERGILHAVER